MICEHVLASSRLEDELAAQLTDTSRCGIGDLTELPAVSIAHCSASEEVGMVEDVEHLDAEVELHPLGDFRVFLHARIGVDRSRPVKEVLLRAAGHATHFIATAEATGEG